MYHAFYTTPLVCLQYHQIFNFIIMMMYDRQMLTIVLSYLLQIIPIEGDFEVNDEPQKTFEGMLPEIVISKYVSFMFM